MDTTQIILALLRGAHVLAQMSLFGTLVSLALVVPAASREAGPAGVPERHGLIVLARWSAGMAVLLGIIWTCMQAAEIAGARTLPDTLAALRPVVLQTQFGHLMVLRGVLLFAACGALAVRRPSLVIVMPLAGAALAIQGFLGHAGAVGGGTGAILLASETLHLLAAGAWIGGLLPLFMLVGELRPKPATAACHAFSLVGAIAVALIAATALEQSSQWFGGLGSLFGTGYGRIALLKIMLFLLLLVLAAINRFVLTARLPCAGEAGARRMLRRSVGTEAILGMLVVLAAASLASTTPATHEQPVWSFSRRPSLDVLADPEGWDMLFDPLALVALSAALIGFGWFSRLTRWPSAVAAAIVLALAGSRLASLLSVEAYPTSFVTSPSEFAVGSIARGAVLFSANCASCHGANGEGDGPAASASPVRPADLTAPHFLAHSDGDLFWFIAHGIDAPSGRRAMPGFSGVLSSEAIWALIDYLHAHNAGMRMRMSGTWGDPVPVPQFDAICADGTTLDLDDLRGRMLRIIAISEDAPPMGALSAGIQDVKTILLTRDRATRPTGSACVAMEPAAWTAFAILLGTVPDNLAGNQLLSDANLWLRERWRPGDADDWNDPRRFAAVVRDLASKPLGRGEGGGNAHHH